MAAATTTARSRETLNRERVLRGAVVYADEHGIETLSMRKLGQALGVEAMSLYNHVANKDDLLDGIVDLVVSEFEFPSTEGDWRTAARRCAIAAHAVLLRHPWMPALSESRIQSGGERLAYYDALIGLFRRGGFSVVGAYRANLTLDSYLYGFTLQEVSWPKPDEGDDLAAAFLERTPADTYPNLVATADAVADGIDLQADFEAGLDAVLDGLEARRETH